MEKSQELIELLEQLKKITYDKNIEKELLKEFCLYLYKELPLIDDYIVSKKIFKRYKNIYYGDVKIYEDGSIDTHNCSGDYVWIVTGALTSVLEAIERGDKRVSKLREILNVIGGKKENVKI